MSLYYFAFLAESLSYVLVFRLVLHTPATQSRIRRCAGIIVLLLWYVLSVTGHEPCPYIIAILFCLLLLFAEKWYFMLCWYMAYSLILLVLSSSITYFIYITANYNINFRLISNWVSLGLLLCIIALCCITRDKTLTFSSLLRTISLKESLLFFFICFMNFILTGISSVLFVYNSINTLGRQLILLTVFFIVLMNIGILYFYIHLRQYHSFLKQNDNMNRRLLQQEKEHYMELQRQNMDIRAFRHDYNQHIMALRELAAAKEDNSVCRYIDNLIEYQEQTNIISTNNIVADAVINYFYFRRDNETVFDVKGKLKQDLFISDSDLCIVLSNLLKNASEALERVPMETERKIMMTLFSNDEYLSIQVKNSSIEYSEKELAELKTTKKASVDHGFGIQNIRTALQKYHGIVDFSYENGCFTANIYIQNF